ncbi:hypothetical protein EII12_07275 [Buchananella hordeovulneris]|uniref:hypothetical protein n=1 Tax=Buchananella hordeovulneris TaxID=52770 RepID=UPI000F5F4159|nr:hypothetical protein [Buchananella hordeovulneris]RRD51822.1 hypothetical protein EII12_07275 [Buchananella hordeovulneris]
MGELRFPRVEDGLANAWAGPGERFTPEYEARLQRVAIAIAACGWRPAIELQGTQDGEVVVAYHPHVDYRAVLFQIEDPSEQQRVDKLLAADSVEPGGAQGLVAHLLERFAQAEGERSGCARASVPSTKGGCGNCSCGS